ncbi:MAG: FHA domain-containing protein [Myxococcales bacterium]|nr:FHA domain-containing protein [Myxococcales bacterium]
MKSLLLSTLRAQFASKGLDVFKAAHPHAWLLWEPGAWRPPQKRTMQFAAITDPKKADGAEALALALDGKDTLVLGRDPACELIINDGTLSARHLVLKRAATGWTVEDAGSSNGTKLHGAALKPHEATPLLEGARIEAAQVILSYWTPEGLWRRLSL